MKKALAVYLLAAVALVGCSKGTDSTGGPDSFVLVNCTLIDGTGSDPIPDACVVIEQGRIAAVGRRDATPVPQDIAVYDLGGATVLPGFINAHVHNGFDSHNLRAWALTGVTTVRDLCGPSSFDLRDRLSADPSYARLVAAGPMLSVPGGYPLVPWGSGCMLAVTSAEDARAKVIQLLEDGADIIKLAVESGESFRMTIPTLSHEEASAIIQTAHENGTVASVHVLVSSDLARALEAGADDIAHMVTDELPVNLIARMISDNVNWVPTLELWYHVGYGQVDAAVRNLREFVRAGGMVALGTDYDGYRAEFQLGMPIDEMGWMRQAGMSNMEIIVAATRNAAHVCNLENDLGTVEAGKIADLLVVNGDPLDNIGSLTNVRMVIHDGVVIRAETSR
ncbi:MAG: amidohydrolase family protein [Candidatus Zixiibacteriota bacterium]|nr:MAG: amidohydrolase family protein [candidate division Zixibacteria bacterium]